MAHHIVRLAYHVFTAIAADVGKCLVGFDDDAAQVGARINELAFGQQGFHLGDGLVVAHETPFTIELCETFRPTLAGDWRR